MSLQNDNSVQETGGFVDKETADKFPELVKKDDTKGELPQTPHGPDYAKIHKDPNYAGPKSPGNAPEDMQGIQIYKELADFVLKAKDYLMDKANENSISEIKDVGSLTLNTLHKILMEKRNELIIQQWDKLTQK